MVAGDAVKHGFSPFGFLASICLWPGLFHRGYQSNSGFYHFSRDPQLTDPWPKWVSWIVS